MSERKWYEWLLTLVYVFMLIVCIFLNISVVQGGSIENVIINAVMFVLVGIIFLNCEMGSFFPTNSMIFDLESVTVRIRKDAQTATQYLWEQYRQKGEEIFENKLLRQRYGDFLREIRRTTAGKKAYYRCDIQEYISPALVDEIMHRNLLNQVAGALTGLGILGTFVGLSFGLQSFAVGSASEITNSIAPLMSGIKVAFHTSIYGMVFSLTFNYVYKRKLEEAETAIRDFLTVYEKYVLPDADTDVVNTLLAIEQQQAEGIEALTTTIAHSLSESMTDLMEPQFKKFDETIAHFAEGAEKNQMDALGVIVNAFIAEMNKSMHNSFSQLSYTIDQTFLLQQKSSEQLQQLLDNTAVQAEKYNEYFRSLQEYMQKLQEATVRMPVDAGKTLTLLQDALNRSDQHFKEMVAEIVGMTRQVPATLQESYSNVERALQETSDAVNGFAELVERLDAEGNRKGSIFGRK